MEQRARTHADLNAMLIGQKTAPKGCRVLNVSPQGMLLQCEPAERLLTFREGDTVTIHLTVQHHSGRKRFAIPAVVNRVDIKRIDVVFPQPNVDLLKLIEAYRASDAHQIEASIGHSRHETEDNISALPKGTHKTAKPRKTAPVSRPEKGKLVYPVVTAIIVAAIIGAGTYLYTLSINDRLNVLETITINQTNELAEMRSRIFSASLQEGRYASLNARLQALTDAFGTLESKLDRIITNPPATAAPPPETASDKTASVEREVPVSITSRRGEESAEIPIDLPATGGSSPLPVVAALPPPGESKPVAATPSREDSHLAAAESAATTTAKSRPAASSPADNLLQAVADGSGPEPADTGPHDVAAISDSNAEPETGVRELDARSSHAGDSATVPSAEKNPGPWVINLLSSRNKRDTDRLAGTASANGIPVVQNRAIVKGKEYWRLQITGFGNAREAKDYAIPVKEKLGIKDVWIFRQKTN